MCQMKMSWPISESHPILNWSSPDPNSDLGQPNHNSDFQGKENKQISFHVGIDIGNESLLFQLQSTVYKDC